MFGMTQRWYQEQSTKRWKSHLGRSYVQTSLKIALFIGCAPLWVGCELTPRPPLPPSERVDFSVDQEVGGETAGELSLDEGVEQDWSPAGETGGELNDMSSQEVDAFFPPPPPRLSERVSVIWGGELIVVWRRDDELWRAKLALQDLETLLTDPQSLLDQRRGAPWVSLPEEWGDLEITLQTTQRESPYLIMSAEGLESVSMSLDLSTPPLIPLGLTTPISVAEGDGATLVVGQVWSSHQNDTSDDQSDLDTEIIDMGRGEPENAKVGWRFARRGAWGQLIIDDVGIRGAHGVARALGGWIISAAEGLCYELSERGGVGGSWRCEAHPDSVMLGHINSVTHWGPLTRLYQEDPNVSGMWLWSGTPGRSVPPLEIEEVSDREALTRSPFSPGGSLAEDQILLSHLGEVRRWVTRGDKPRVIFNTSTSEDPSASLILTEGGYATLPDLLDSESIVNLIDSTRGPLLIIWDNEIGGVQLLDLTDDWIDAPLPVTPPSDEACLVEAERCDEVDHDCDGLPRNQLCCPEGEIASARLDDVLFPDLDWWSADSEIGLLIAVASQGRARLFSMSHLGGDSTLRASWNGIESLERFGHYLSLVALIGRDEGGAPYLLLNRREVEGDASSDFLSRPLPCEPQAVAVLDESHATRVYCPEHALLIEADGSESIEQYPEEGELRWATRYVEGGSGSGREVKWLVALGEADQLSIWRDLGRGGVSYLESDLVMTPPELGELTALDRALPLQLPSTQDGLLARRLSMREVEVWVSGLGWTRVGGHRWPYWATISEAHSAAITVGYSEDPRDVGDRFLQRLNLRVHPLSRRGALLGHSLRERISRDSFGGAHFSRYLDESGADPNLFTLIGGSVELSSIVCQ